MRKSPLVKGGHFSKAELDLLPPPLRRGNEGDFKLTKMNIINRANN
jgi:hypothetical protein